MLKNVIAAITTERSGTLHTNRPVVRNRMENPAKRIIEMIRHAEAAHGAVLAELGDEREDALFNVVLARFESEFPAYDAEVASRLVRRTIDARLTGVI